MIKKTLSFYIAWHFIKILIMIIFGLSFLVFTVDFIDQLRKTANMGNIKTWQLYNISLMRTPIFVERIFPFACLFSAMITLNRLNAKMELVVARAAGISAWQFLLPISIPAALVGILVITIYNPLAINAFRASNELSAKLLPGKENFGESLTGNHWIKQEDDKGGLSFFNAKLVRREGKLLDQVKVIRFDNNGIIMERIDAVVALYMGDRWILINAKRTNNKGESTQYNTIDITTRLSEEDLLGVGTEPDEVPFWDLQSVAERVENSGTNGKPYLVQYHTLTALPLFLIAMTLVAATVSLRFVRFGQLGKMILGGIFFGFVLYTVTSLTMALGNNGVVPPVVAAWAPGVVAILFGTSMLLHQEDG